MEEILEFFTNKQYASLIQGLAAIGTFVASIVALITIRLVKKQIRNSHRPNVALTNTKFSDCVALEGDRFRTIWVKEDEIKENDELFSTLAFSVINAGVGYAEQVEIEDYFNMKAAIKFIKNNDSLASFDISNEDGILRIKPTFQEDWIRIEHINDTRQVGNLLTNTQSSFIFNDEYLAFLSCHSYLREFQNEFLSLEQFPPLKFKIRFKDIDGKKYTNKYICKPFCINHSSYSFTFIKQ